MSKLRITKIVLLVVGALLVVAFLHYHLPRTAIVTIQGVDVKRMDSRGSMTQNPGTAGSRDVRFINTVKQDNRVLVLRNEDTGWGWPPYFKFNSSDLVAQAQAFANENPPPTVLITFYGWRIQLFSLYPNITRMRSVAPDYSHFPWFNIIFLVLLGSASIFIGLKVKQLSQRIRERFSKNQAPPGAAGDDSRPEDQ
ncbi:MAG: DUF1523 family protein [Desulfobacterales bacterium]|nr:DUF1523 family protein [Desulfobacterales bacterium]MDJ0885262.1 DUF1523 family protein [Desulfobacterales bacterium]